MQAATGDRAEMTALLERLFVGRVVLTESDDDWEHTPEYSGCRPLAGMR